MSFFEIPEPPPSQVEERPEPPEWSGPPRGVLPALSPQRAVLARTDDLVLVADRFLVYPNGVVFTLTLMMREPPDHMGDMPWELHHRQRGAKRLPDEFVRFGILFGDGSKWTNLDWGHRVRDEDVTGPVVMGRGGGGGGDHWEMDYWVWPLPPPGSMTFVVSWPSEGIAERMVDVDADDFHVRADQAERIWPA